MEYYWFKNRRFGFGWRPATWQGWALTVGVVTAMIGVAIYGEYHQFSELQIVSAIGALVFSFLMIVYRTGEPLTWNWGSTKEKPHEKQ